MTELILNHMKLNMLQSRDAYANQIIEDLKKAELIVVEGTLYPLLTRLKNAGLEGREKTLKKVLFKKTGNKGEL